MMREAMRRKTRRNRKEFCARGDGGEKKERATTTMTPVQSIELENVRDKKLHFLFLGDAEKKNSRRQHALALFSKTPPRRR